MRSVGVYPARGPPTPTAPTPAPVTPVAPVVPAVTILPSRVSPREIVVAVGDRATFINNDVQPHDTAGVSRLFVS